ncbi:MAG: hypothetical protein U0930_17740 [Pirellulales bacterium]
MLAMDNPEEARCSEMDTGNQRESHVTVRCTEVAGRPFPDGKFTSRDIGDRGRYVLQGHGFGLIGKSFCVNSVAADTIERPFDLL